MRRAFGKASMPCVSAANWKVASFCTRNELASSASASRSALRIPLPLQEGSKSNATTSSNPSICADAFRKSMHLHSTTLSAPAWETRLRRSSPRLGFFSKATTRKPGAVAAAKAATCVVLLPGAAQQSKTTPLCSSSAPCISACGGKQLALSWRITSPEATRRWSCKSLAGGKRSKPPTCGSSSAESNSRAKSACSWINVCLDFSVLRRT
mmetsp:Transcript_23346/g.65106  ORF Transcript_23346/g.65106 Transcript_23346/m.65106 type:complete len:210 (+) Transcript_23346:381-1010(+)